jgi:hypothetical protein
MPREDQSFAFCGSQNDKKAIRAIAQIIYKAGCVCAAKIEVTRQDSEHGTAIVTHEDCCPLARGEER